jgi:hypothetical protein
MVPMHLALIDRPFVSHILISAQYSPVLLPKFQMAPTLKIFMSSGSKKGTQIYCPFLSQKFPASKSPPGSQQGPCRESYLLTGHFYISVDISLYLKGLMKRASPHVPQKWGPYANRRPCQSLPYLVVVVVVVAAAVVVVV